MYRYKRVPSLSLVCQKLNEKENRLWCHGFGNYLGNGVSTNIFSSTTGGTTTMIRRDAIMYMSIQTTTKFELRMSEIEGERKYIVVPWI